MNKKLAFVIGVVITLCILSLLVYIWAAYKIIFEDRAWNTALIKEIKSQRLLQTFLEECDKVSSRKLVDTFKLLLEYLPKMRWKIESHKNEEDIEKEISFLDYNDIVPTIKSKLLSLSDAKFFYLFSELKRTVGHNCMISYIRALSIDNIIIIPEELKSSILDELDPLQSMYVISGEFFQKYLKGRAENTKICIAQGKMKSENIVYIKRAKRTMYDSLKSYTKLISRLFSCDLISRNYNDFDGQIPGNKVKIELTEGILHYLNGFASEIYFKLSPDIIKVSCIDLRENSMWDTFIDLINRNFENEKIESIEFYKCKLPNPVLMNQLPAIKEIKIIGSAVDRPALFDCLKQFSSLQKLAIEGLELENDFSSFLSLLRELPGLEELSIAENWIGTERVANALEILEDVNIKKLDISGNEITSTDPSFNNILRSFEKMKNSLVSLRMKNNVLIKAAEFRKMTRSFNKLLELNMENTSIIFDEKGNFSQAISSLESIERLNFSNCCLEMENVKELLESIPNPEKVVCLDLRNFDVENYGIEVLDILKTLRNYKGLYVFKMRYDICNLFNEKEILRPYIRNAGVL